MVDEIWFNFSRKNFSLNLLNRPVSLVVKAHAIGAVSLGFGSWTGKVRRSLANGSPPLRRFVGAGYPWCQAAEMGPATCYTLRRDNAHIMKI